MGRVENGKRETNSNFIACFQKYKIQILLFLTVFGIKIILNVFLKSLTISTGYDDIGTIAGAAYFAGLDWSDVISNTLYYGWGYSMFMAPAFLLTDNIRFLFQIMLAYNALLLALSVVICYTIMNTIFHIEKQKFCILVSLASNFFFFALIDTNIIFNETALIFLTWVILYIMLKMQKNIYSCRSNIWLTIALVLIMGYGLTVHTRFLLVWGAVCVMLLFFALIKKKCLVNPWIFSIGIVSFYFVVNKLSHMVQDGLWLANKSDKPLVNSMDSLGGQFANIKDLFHIDGLAGFMHMLLGQSTVMFFFSGGLMLAFIILTVIMIKRMFKKAFSKKDCFMVTELEEITDVQIASGIIFIASLLIATILFVNIGAIGVAKTAIEKGRGSKWYVYSRYWGACCPMAIMFVFTFIYTNKEKVLKKMISIISLIGMVLTGVLFGIFVATKMIGVKVSSSLVYQVLMGFTLNNIDDRFKMSNMIFILIFGGIWFLILLLLFYKKKYNVAAVFTMIVFIYIFSYKMIAVDIHTSEQAYNQYIDTKGILDTYDIHYDDYKKIYVDSNLKNYFNAQFVLNRYELIVSDYDDYSILQQEDCNIELALTEQIGEEMCNNWYILYQKNEIDKDGEERPLYYLLVRKGDLSKKLIQQEVPLIDIADIYGMKELLFKNNNKNIRNIGIEKLKNTDILEQDFDVTSKMLNSNQFSIALMFRNPSQKPSKGKVVVTVSQNELKKSFFVSMDNITTREWVNFFVDSMGFVEGKATITITSPDMSQYKYVLPYTVASEENEDSNSTNYLRLNNQNLKGQLFMQIFIPYTMNGIHIAPYNIVESDKSVAKQDVGSLANEMKLIQKINISQEMLSFKYIGMDFWVKNYGDSSSKGKVSIRIRQGDHTETFHVNQSDLSNKDYIRFYAESKKYSVGEAIITVICRGVEDKKYIKPYTCTYDESEIPVWFADTVNKDNKKYDSYLCMNVFGFMNTYSSKKYQ